jgi:hypothetical protein
MKKLLLVICFLALCSLGASAQTVQFDGFCDGLQVNPSGIVFGGTHLLGDCANNFFGGGFIHTAPGFTFYPGKVYDFSDPLFGLFGINASIEFLVNIKPSKKKNCGWVIYEGPDGVGNYFLNAGTCTKVANAKALLKGTKSSTNR